ncbi:MAG: hypothetical protein ABMA25_10205 [Ilumatobacteraceae bacterium]
MPRLPLLATAGSAPDWISAVATAVAVIFAFFAWRAARGTTDAQASANAQQAEALRIQSEMLKQAQDSISEQRHQRIAGARSRASKLRVTQAAGPFVAWDGGSAVVGGEPALQLENRSDVPFHSVFVSFLEPDDVDPMDGQKEWAEVLDPGEKWSLPIPPSATNWYVEFMDVDDLSWRVTAQYPMPELATGGTASEGSPTTT